MVLTDLLYLHVKVVLRPLPLFNFKGLLFLPFEISFCVWGIGNYISLDYFIQKQVNINVFIIVLGTNIVYLNDFILLWI